METQINSYCESQHSNSLINIFGYSSKAMPSLEINGVGSRATNIKEKIIYLTRTRKLKIPNRRFVICVDTNELEGGKISDVKWLEFPILLCFWHLAGLIPIKKLDDCLAAGRINVNGEIIHLPLNQQTCRELINESAKKRKTVKFITNENIPGPFATINSQLLLEHIPRLNFKKAYIERSSVIPTNSCMT